VTTDQVVDAAAPALGAALEDGARRGQAGPQATWCTPAAAGRLRFTASGSVCGSGAQAQAQLPVRPTADHTSALRFASSKREGVLSLAPAANGRFGSDCGRRQVVDVWITEIIII
jgi:hypothetical protein